MRHRIRTVLALTRAQVRSLVPVTMGVTGCAIAGDVFARCAYGISADPSPVLTLALIALTSFFAIVPIIASAFDTRGEGTLQRQLGALPVGGRFLARSAAVALSVCFVLGVFAAVDAVLVVVAPAPASGLPVDPSVGFILYLGCALAVVVTTIVGAVVQHALGATLLGYSISAGLLVLLAQSPSSRIGLLGAFLLEAATVPVMLATVFVCLAIIPFLAPLRGARIRSAWRRARPAALMAVLPLAVPVSALASMTLLGSEPAWGGYIAAALPSPDGEQVLFQRLHGKGTARGESFWLLDVRSGDVDLLPHPVRGLESVLRPPVHARAWTQGGSFVECEIESRWGRGARRELIRVSKEPGTAPSESWRVHASRDFQDSWGVTSPPVDGRVESVILHLWSGRVEKRLPQPIIDPAVVRPSPRGMYAVVGALGEERILVDFNGGRQQVLALGTAQALVVTDHELPLLVREEDGAWRRYGFDGPKGPRHQIEGHPWPLTPDRFVVERGLGLTLYDADLQVVRQIGEPRGGVQ